MSAAKPTTHHDDWVERGGAVSFKWAEQDPGAEWIGTWLGREPGGKFGDRGLLDVGTDVLKLGLPTVLDNRTKDLPAGTRVKIVYGGMEKNDLGKPFHMFKLFTLKDAAPPKADAPPPRSDRKAAPPDDDVSF
jgi:hypothetical protein